MGAEKRKHERKKLNSDKVEGNFYLDVDGESYELLDVCDVTIGGVGMAFEHALSPETPVKIVYEAPHIQVSLPGEIAWCRPAEDAKHVAKAKRYQIGIKLDQENISHNSLLFMAMQKFMEVYA